MKFNAIIATYYSFTLTLIGLGILTAGLSYIASIFYLYLHYEAEQRYTTAEVHMGNMVPGRST